MTVSESIKVNKTTLNDVKRQEGAFTNASELVRKAYKFITQSNSIQQQKDIL